VTFNRDASAWRNDPVIAVVDAGHLSITRAVSSLAEAGVGVGAAVRDNPVLAALLMPAAR